MTFYERTVCNEMDKPYPPHSFTVTSDNMHELSQTYLTPDEAWMLVHIINSTKTVRVGDPESTNAFTVEYQYDAVMGITEWFAIVSERRYPAH